MEADGCGFTVVRWGETVRRSYGFVYRVRDGCRFHGGKEGSGGRLGGCLLWDGCSIEHSPTCPSAPRSTCVGAWGWVTTAVSGKLCIYAVSTLLLIQPFVFQVVEKTFVCRVLRDDWIANAVLFCLFIKHRALVCHEMTEISLLMRIQGKQGKLYLQQVQRQLLRALLQHLPLWL